MRKQDILLASSLRKFRSRCPVYRECRNRSAGACDQITLYRTSGDSPIVEALIEGRQQRQAGHRFGGIARPV